MLLDYKNLRNKYLKYFDNDEHYCDFVLADVVFGFSEVSDFLKKRNVSWVVLLSSKGAKTFQANAQKVFNKEDLSCINFACISSNVAKKLNKKLFKTFYPENPNIDFIKKIISQYEKKYGS